MNNNEQHASLTSTRGRAEPVLEKVKIEARVTAPLLEVDVAQHYRNASKKAVEVVYTFPVPPRAVLLGVQFTLGERKLAGVVKAKSQAEQDYDAAVDRGDSAVLVECQKDGMYTANLGNLKPGEQAVIRIRYGQLLAAQGEDWRIAIPTVLAPFYGDAEADGGLDPRAAPTQSLEADYPLELSLTVPAGTQRLRCTSHEARIEPAGEAIVAQLPADARLDRDVVFLLGRAAAPAVLSAPDREGAVVIASTVLRPDQVGALPVSVRLVLDCSGSMAGDSMDWATVGCQHLVERLRDNDEFSITRFGSSFEHMTKRMIAASPEHRADCAQRLLDITADLGGTEMEQALKAAARLESGRERSDVVLVTDGEIWASDALVRWARGTGLRVFVIGVGAAPNHPFLSRLAEETGGTCEFVTPGEDMIEAVKRLVQRLREPRREAVEIAWPVQPEWTLQLPPVAHAGQTVHLVAGFKAAPAGAVTAAGTTVALPTSTSAGDALARVVAYQRLLSGHFTEAAAAAEAYQLVTEWTSLVAVLERADADKSCGLPELAKVDHMLAAGWGGSGSVARHASRSASAGKMRFGIDTGAVFRTRIGSSHRVSAVVDVNYDIPAFLRRCEDPVEPTSPTPPPTPEQVLEMGRAVAMERYREELTRWVRAINRRALVESMAERPFRPTLQWLGTCVGARMVDCIGARVTGNEEEAPIVAAFIELLGLLGAGIEECFSEATRDWMHAHRASGANRARHRDLVRAALDDFLFQGTARPAPPPGARVSA